MLWFAALPFGVEGIAAAELRRMQLSDVKPENGRVYFEADYEGAFRANLWLRTAERVYLQAGAYPVQTFEDLFQGMLSIPWEELAPPNAAIPVRAQCVRSRIMSPSDCQKIMKKAIAERFRIRKGLPRLPETGPEFAVSLWLNRDEAVIGIDSSGEALHKRGYRVHNHEAPLRETLAAAILLSGPWRTNMPLCDPMCGSGVIPIEAAMLATNRAPGLNRHFAIEKWPQLSPDSISRIRLEAEQAFRPPVSPITASDIDPAAIELSLKHARLASLDSHISFTVADAATLSPTSPRGVYCCNPPYGQRIGDDDQARLSIETLRSLKLRSPGWAVQFITAYPGAQRAWAAAPRSQRRFYNGRLECVSFVY